MARSPRDVSLPPCGGGPGRGEAVAPSAVPCASGPHPSPLPDQGEGNRARYDRRHRSRHRLPPRARAASACALPRWLAWQMAMASASASSALSNLAFGSRKPTMAAIWRFSPWPVPVTVFLTTLGGYSATRRPALRRRQQRHAARLAELQGGARILVDEGLLDGGLLRLEAGDHLDQPLVDGAQAVGQVVLAVRGDEPAGDVGRAARRPTRRCPSRCGAGPDRCR